MDLTCNGENHHFSFLMIEIMSINHLDYDKSFQTLKSICGCLIHIVILITRISGRFYLRFRLKMLHKIYIFVKLTFQMRFPFIFSSFSNCTDTLYITVSCCSSVQVALLTFLVERFQLV